MKLLSGKTYYIMSKSSGLVLDLRGASQNNGTSVVQWPKHGGLNQRFKLEAAGDGYYYIMAEHSGQIFDIAGGGKNNGTNLIQWPKHGGANQQFRIEEAETGYYYIISRHSDLFIEVAGVSKDQGANVYQWQKHGGDNQKWQFIDTAQAKAADPVKEGKLSTEKSYHIAAKHSGHILDVSEASKKNGANVIQWPKHGGLNQRFKLEAAGDGYYYIIAEHSGQILNIAGGGKNNGMNLIQWPKHGGSNQQFRIEEAEPGYYYIISRHSDLVIDVAGVSNDQGANVYQWQKNSGDNQKWQFAPVTVEPLIFINNIFYDGLEKWTESDEFIEISNKGDVDVDISGWKISADDKGQTFSFPNHVILNSKKFYRVYTNKIDKETGGFSFKSKKPIWNNKGDVASICDNKGKIIDSVAYGNKIKT